MRKFWYRFFPDLMVDEISEIPREILKQRGIIGLILDLDNTIVPWDGLELSRVTKQWIIDAQKEGFAFFIVSNSTTARVEHFSRLLNIPAISLAQKPRRVNFRKALQAMNLSPHQVAVIGDQVFTDVWGGNRLGCFTILVIPMNRRESFHTYLVRYLERIVLRRFRRTSTQP